MENEKHRVDGMLIKQNHLFHLEGPSKNNVVKTPLIDGP
jgi:hypothetical protein